LRPADPTFAGADVQRGHGQRHRDRPHNPSDAREEVNTMAKKDDGRREIKKGTERDY
jgi:hypothetical protein